MSADALKQQALKIVEVEQDSLAQAYQEQQRLLGHEYSYFDALDMIIGEASQNPAHFINEQLPALRDLAGQQGDTLFEVEY
ncbi:hypothetical protein JFT44_25525 [Pseudomonas sp. MF5691]|uniref:hypothetical protein n=1 Tax=Pseudomonas sp. MF5691 TaxID=2797526 RepID=UPI0018E7D708|nr:hypothetical protein [Pseudomonas sp. MF5691]MBJ2293284.1 hypothetical protein [Pseudomonas sp. MF5691]